MLTEQANGVYVFHSQYTALQRMSDYTQEQIKNEPMLFNCTFQYAWEHGGPITREFLKLLHEYWQEDSVFDSRVHMLMPGWFPCIPGYHHDDVPRTRADGQPNYDDPNHYSQHIMATVNGEIAPTYGVTGTVVVPIAPLGQKIYSVWHDYLTKEIKSDRLTEEAIPSNLLVEFDSNFFHRGSAAVKNGWRWFGRISRNTTRKPSNEIRRQAQVYMSDLTEGW